VQFALNVVARKDASEDLELTAMLCHEMTQPLCFLLTNLGAARVGLARVAANRYEPRLAQLERWIEDAYECADQLGHVLADIRTHIRREPERQAKAELGALLDRALAMVETDAYDRARILRDYDRVPAMVCSAWRLQQVFLNLLSNSLRAIPTGAREENHIAVRLRADEETSRIVIEIRDTGGGIEKDETVRREKGGMGLGLAISERILAAHGGTLALEPNQPRGTVARITLPLEP
jgi:signal transduction histidine kinase